MKTVTIGFSKSKKPLAIGSFAIRTYMGTPYSHVYLRFYSSTLNRVLIYEAVGAGIRFVGVDTWKEHAVEVASFDISVEDVSYVRLMQYCVDNSGKEYGFIQNMGVPLSRLLGLNHNPFNTAKNCSEVVSDVLKLEGYTFTMESNLIVPRDIYEVLSKGKLNGLLNI